MDGGEEKVLVEEKNGSTSSPQGIAKTVFVAGSDRSYIDTQIAELKKYF